MKVVLKQAARFGNKDYRLGYHEVDSEVVASPNFQRLLEAGLIVPATKKDMPQSNVPYQARQKEMAEKLKGLPKQVAKPASVSSEAGPVPPKAPKTILRKAAPVKTDGV